MQPHLPPQYLHILTAFKLLTIKLMGSGRRVATVCLCLTFIHNTAATYDTSCSALKTRLPWACDGEYCLAVLGDQTKLARIYCHDMLGTPTDYLTLTQGGTENYADYALNKFNGDPYNMGGRSAFSKVKLNPATLAVTSNDLTFCTITNTGASYSAGTGPSYASAGDCLHPTAAQGQFKVDLQGTGFYVARTASWTSSGTSSSQSITVSRAGEVVSGVCGGGCGACSPTSSLTLDFHPKLGPACPSPLGDGLAIIGGTLTDGDNVLDGTVSTCATVTIEEIEPPPSCPQNTEAPTVPNHVTIKLSQFCKQTLKLTITFSLKGVTCSDTFLAIKYDNTPGSQVLKFIYCTEGAHVTVLGVNKCTFECLPFDTVFLFVPKPTATSTFQFCELTIA